MIAFFKDIFKVEIKYLTTGARDIGLSLLPQLSTAFFGFIISIFIARGLGPEELGKYVLINSFIALISGFSDLGINQTAIRFASRAVSQNQIDLQHNFLRWSLRIRLVLVSILILITYVIAPFIAKNFWNVSSISYLIRINLLIVFFNVFSSIPIIYFQSRKKFGKNAVVSIGQTVVNFSGIGVIALLGLWSLEYVVFISVLSSACAMLIFIFIVPKSVFWRSSDFKKSKLNQIKSLFKSPQEKNIVNSLEEKTTPDAFTYYMILTSVIVIITMQSDVWLMGHYLSKDQVGIYNVAMKLAAPLVMFLNAFNISLWPRASALVKINEINFFLRKTVKVSFLVFLVALLYSFFVPILIPVLYSSSYSNSIFIGQLLCFRYCISILVCPVGIIGYSLGLVRIYWIINLFQLILVLFINIILLPVLGPVASAISLICNELVGFILTGIIIWRKINNLS